MKNKKNSWLLVVGRLSSKLLYALVVGIIMDIVAHKMGLVAECIVSCIALALYTECISKRIDAFFRTDNV